MAKIINCWYNYQLDANILKSIPWIVTETYPNTFEHEFTQL